MLSNPAFWSGVIAGSVVEVAAALVAYLFLKGRIRGLVRL